MMGWWVSYVTTLKKSLHDVFFFFLDLPKDQILDRVFFLSRGLVSFSGVSNYVFADFFYFANVGEFRVREVQEQLYVAIRSSRLG